MRSRSKQCGEYIYIKNYFDQSSKIKKKQVKRFFSIKYFLWKIFQFNTRTVGRNAFIKISKAFKTLYQNLLL